MVGADVHVLLTDEDSHAILEPNAEACGFRVFSIMGGTEDVLFRYAAAARLFGVDTVVRATGDNPLVQGHLAWVLLRWHLDVGADFSAYQGMFPGYGVEIIQSSALFEAEREAVSEYDRQHVGPFLYTHPERFLLHRPLAPKVYRGRERMTVDTRTDYESIQKYF